MQLSTLFVTILFGSVLLLKNYTYGYQIDFPVQECAAAVATQNYWACAGKLAFSLWKLHNWNEDTPINICGIPCKGNLKGRLSKWQWKWDGRFRCDSKAPGIVGHDTKQSKNGAMEWAIKDFLNRAMKSGQVKPEEFRC